MLGILRLPSALVTAVQGRGSGLFGAALCAEPSPVYMTAGTSPALSGLGRAAFGTEFSRVLRAAAALPGAGGRGGGGLSAALTLTHLVQRIGIQTAGGLGHVHAHEAHHGPVFVSGSGLHGFRLSLHHVSGGHVGIAEDSAQDREARR